MSVPVPKRSKNELQALQDTLEFVVYTIHMCENEKIFPKKTRWTLCTRLIDTCLNIVCDIRSANKINVQTKEQAELRTKLQYEVLLDFEKVWGLLTVAEKTYPIPKEKLHNVSNLLLKSENIVTNWRNSDIKKYKDQNLL